MRTVFAVLLVLLVVAATPIIVFPMLNHGGSQSNLVPFDLTYVPVSPSDGLAHRSNARLLLEVADAETADLVRQRLPRLTDRAWHYLSRSNRDPLRTHNDARHLTRQVDRAAADVFGYGVVRDILVEEIRTH